MIKRKMEAALRLVLVMVACGTTHAGILYPQQSETREVKSLDGIWKFRLSPSTDQEVGFRQLWYNTSLDEWIRMPVPSSYNDVTVDANIRDYVGWVWYQREFFVPKRWENDGQRIFLRFGGVHYNALVWLNGKLVTEHSGGHLPFQGEVGAHLQYGASNLLTVAVNNTLTQHTIPQGSVTHTNDTNMYPEGYVINAYSFDFFNYAGIQRPVHLYTVPQAYVDDISVRTDVSNGTGLVEYEVDYGLGDNNINSSNVRCVVQLLDANKSVVVPEVEGCRGEITVPEAKLWWPVYMNASPGYRYTLLVRLMSTTAASEDVYRLSFGIRSLSWNDSKLSINGKPVYLRGFGKHEDSNIRGKGLDLPIVVRDYNLIDWVAGNSFRTSHYPYAEEILEMADALGIMVVDESPGVNLDTFDEVLLEKHKDVMKEFVQRDKNRACVIMWSLSNEAHTHETAAGPYYRDLANYTRSLDTSRPIAFVTNQQYNEDKAAEYVDIIGVNRYNAWYSNAGHLDLIVRQVVSDFTEWYKRFNKPIFISEYGADSIPGIHVLPSFTWSEEYQAELLQHHFKAFDRLRQQGFFVGEMIWNFADFATRQDYTRVVGNHKGIFTRERQPKASAHTLRARYRQLASAVDDFHWPEHVKEKDHFHSEL